MSDEHRGDVFVLSEFPDFGEQVILGVYKTLAEARNAVSVPADAWRDDDDAHHSASIFSIERVEFHG